MTTPPRHPTQTAGARLLLCLLGLSSLTGCAVSREADEQGSQLGLKRALINEELARYESDRSEFEPTISTVAHYHFLRGELALAQDSLDEALEAFREAAKEEESSAPFLRYRLAQVLVRKGQLDEALSEMEKVPDEEQTDPSFLELKGGILATLKKTDEAIATYRKLIDSSPTPNEEAYLLLVSLYLSQENPDAARAELNKLLKSKPNSVLAFYYLGRIAEGQGNPAEAEKLYRRALEINPRADSVKVDLARCLGATKRFREGIAICEEILRGDPDNLPARKMLSQLLLGANRIDDALKQLESLQQLENDTKDTRFKIALIKLERRDFTGAETELNLILSQQPEDATARYYLALAYAGMSRPGDGIEQLGKIAPTEKLYVQARLLGAHLLRQDKKLAEARAFLEEALRNKKDDIRLLAFLVNIQKDAGQTRDAILTMNEIIKIDPKNDGYYFTLGVFHDELKERDLAIGAMEKAIEINPDNGNALNYLGYSLAEKGVDLPRAESLTKRAVAIEKDNAYYIDSLGWVYYQMGRYEDSVKQLERAVKLVPDDAVLLEHLGRSLWKVGKKKKAVTILNQALKHAPSSDDQEVQARLEEALQRIKSGSAP